MDQATTSRTRSVYKDTEAADFMQWLLRIWSGLTDEQKAGAYMEARQSVGMAMVGLRYRDSDSSSPLPREEKP